MTKRRHRKPFYDGPIGHCIYCKSGAGPLSDEHIVPLGLNGTWVLEAASCSSCAAITSNIEMEMQRRVFGALRSILRLRTRRTKQRSKTLPVGLNTGEGTVEWQIEARTSPILVVLPVFQIPCHLSGADPVHGIRIVNWDPHILGATAPADLALAKGATQLQLKIEYDPAKFARALVKIAYAYCVYALGESAFKEVYVVKAILGQDEGVGKWAGSATARKQRPKTLLHRLETRVMRGDIVCFVRLFAAYTNRDYVVVVGKAALPAPGEPLWKRLTRGVTSLLPLRWQLRS